MTSTPYALGDAPARPALVDATALYVTGEDHLRLTSFNGLADVALVVEGRFVDCTGRLVPFSERHVPNTDRTAATSTYTLGEGWLCNVQVRASAAAPLQGQTFVVLELVRGRTGAIQPLGCVLQGYLTSTQRLAWPGSPLRASVDGAGVVRTILGTDPAAGVEIAETVPAGVRWALRSVRFTLTTDATAANRRPTFIIDDGANEIWRVNSNVDQTATQISIYEAGAGAPFATLDARVFSLPLPVGLELLEGYRLRTSTAAIVAGDNYSAPVYQVEEWIAG